MALRKKNSEEERKRKQKESMKRLRESRRNNADVYEHEKAKERERYKRRKNEGKIKLINQMSEREKRSQRKEWRNRSKKSYDLNKERRLLEKNLEENSPPNSPESDNGIPLEGKKVDCRTGSGKKRRRRTLNNLKRKINDLEEKLKIVEKRKDKYRMRLARLENNKKETPRKKVKKILEGQKVSHEVRKKLLFGEVIRSQLQTNFKNLKHSKSKKSFWNNISGKILNKYKFTNEIISLTSYSYVGQKSRITKRNHRKYIGIVKENVQTFLEKDENSRLCAGKKECLTKKKIKKQRRYLNNSLKYLYKKFLVNYPCIKISFSLFCRMRPFWILPARANNRNTCLCLLHTNVSYMTKKLRMLKVIKETSSQDLITTLCCAETERTKDCFDRKCEACKYKTITAMVNTNFKEQTKFERWTTKSEKVLIKEKLKVCKKTVKETVSCTVEELLNKLNGTMDLYLQHIRNIQHQYRALDLVKKSLNINDILIHADFSENYECKYKEEVQAAHFGGSKSQISLFTVVVYYKAKDEDELKSQSFCSISKCLRHDASAVFAHLQPILEYMKNIIPKLDVVHFLSDGPSSQFRNSKIFYLIKSYLTKKVEANVIRWHYTEKGHGKGAPDGVGGCLKRTADMLVGRGLDISCIEQFFKHLSVECPSIILRLVTKSAIESFDKLIPNKLTPFKGTLKIHEMTWDKTCDKLQARELICITCSARIKCLHYGLGEISITMEENYTDTSRPTVREINNIVSEASTSLASLKSLESRPKKRMRYSEVYEETSSESDSDSNQKCIKKTSPKINDYILVKVFGTKTVKQYVANVLEVISKQDFKVKFMCRCPETKNKFVFSSEPEAIVSIHDIVQILTQPTLNSRLQYFFKEITNAVSF